MELNSLYRKSKRGRSESISGRLRAASDLEEIGWIDKTQKGVIKDLIISGDETLRSALDKYENGDAHDLEGIYYLQSIYTITVFEQQKNRRRHTRILLPFYSNYYNRPKLPWASCYLNELPIRKISLSQLSLFDDSANNWRNVNSSAVTRPFGRSGFRFS